MRCVITDQRVLSRAPEGPLSAYIRPFADLLSAQGYALKSMHRQVHLAAPRGHALEERLVEVLRSRDAGVVEPSVLVLERDVAFEPERPQKREVLHFVRRIQPRVHCRQREDKQRHHP